MQGATFVSLVIDVFQLLVHGLQIHVLQICLLQIHVLQIRSSPIFYNLSNLFNRGRANWQFREGTRHIFIDHLDPVVSSEGTMPLLLCFVLSVNIFRQL